MRRKTQKPDTLGSLASSLNSEFRMQNSECRQRVEFQRSELVDGHVTTTESVSQTVSQQIEAQDDRSDRQPG